MKLDIKNLKIAYLILVGLAAFFLLVAHTFSLFSVVVDTYSILLIGLLLLLPFIPSLKKIKWGDFEADLLDKTKLDVIKDLNKEFPINEEDINKIYASATTGSLASATADIMTSKKICPSCKNVEMKEIPWEEKFNKCLGNKELVNKPEAYKCDNCGYTIIQYDEV